VDAKILTNALVSAYKNDEPTGLLWRELFKALNIPVEWLDR
jgi:hypothetical protein